MNEGFGKAFYRKGNSVNHWTPKTEVAVLLISERMTTHPIPNYPTIRVEACCQSRMCCGMQDGNCHFGSRHQP